MAITIRVPYSVTSAGKVSLAIYDGSGRLVRTLLTGARMNPGHYVAGWDGLDRYGNALPAGRYGWRLLQTKGLTSSFLMKIGDNASPLWERSPGSDEGTACIAADSSGVYRFATVAEGSHFGVKTDYGGKYLWTVDGHPSHCFFGGLALAVGKGHVYDLYCDGGVVEFNGETGNAMLPSPWNLRWPGDPEMSAAGSPDTGDYSGGCEHAVMDMAFDAAHNLLVVTYKNHDGVRWFDAASGNVVDNANTLKAPLGVAAAADGTVLAISGGAVVSLNREHKEPVTVIPATELRDAYRLAVDKSGNMFVAENSSALGDDKPANQVLKFAWSGSGVATLVRSYGAPEGRTDGLYRPTDFVDLHEIAADNAGGFLIAEGPWTPPRRGARFDANGALLREWYGGQNFGVNAVPEPGDPSHVWIQGNAPISGMVRCNVDYAHKSWSVAEVYCDTFAKQGLNGAASEFVNIVKYHGRMYLYAGDPSPLSVMLYDPIKHTLRMCCQSGQIYRADAGTWFLPESMRPTDGSKPLSYIWNDLNDDGIATQNEMTYTAHWPLGGYIDPKDMAVYGTYSASCYVPGFRAAPLRFTSGGTPVYAFKEGDAHPAWKENGESYYPDSLYHDEATGDWYGTISQVFLGWEKHGVWYFNSQSGLDRLVKWSSNWAQEWSVGRHSPDPDHEIGSTDDARHLAGVTHGCEIWSDGSDEEIAPPTVWTSDGLYIDEIPHTQGEGSDKEAYGRMNGLETPTFSIADDGQNGVYLYCASSSGGSPVYDVTGWNNWTRTAGNVTLPVAAPQAARLGTGLVATYYNSTDCSGTPALTRTDPKIDFSWGTDTPDKAITTPGHFSCQWVGKVEAFDTNEYKFAVIGPEPGQTAGGGNPAWSRLWVDGKLVVDWTSAQGCAYPPASEELGLAYVSLKAGAKYDIKVQCGFTASPAYFRLAWDTPDIDRRDIPEQYLYPVTTPLTVAGGSQVAYWKFDDGSGSAAADAGGNDHVPTVSKASWTANGRVNGGLVFNGAAGIVTCPIVMASSASTVALWFKTTVPNGGLFCVSDGAGRTDRDIYLSGGEVKARLGTDIIGSEGARLADGHWHHVVHVFGGAIGEQRLYLDGSLIDIGSNSASTLVGQSQVVVGYSPRASSPHFRGVIDEVHLYDQALSARSILDDLYRREVGLIAFLPCDDGAGLFARSVVGAGIYGTVTGSSRWIPRTAGGGIEFDTTGPLSPAGMYIEQDLRLPVTDYSLAFRFKTTDTDVALMRVERDTPYNDAWRDNWLYLQGGNLLCSVIGDTLTPASGKLNDGQWHQVTLTIGGESGPGRLYVDGILQATGKLTIRTYTSNRLGLVVGPTRFSGPLGGQLGLFGTVSVRDVRVYGRAISASEVKSIASGQIDILNTER